MPQSLSSVVGVIFVVALALCQIHLSVSSMPHIEVSSLHDLYTSTGGSVGWLWRNETEYGAPWDFAQAGDGSYLHDPCVGWQGIVCINADGVQCNSTLNFDEPCNIVRLNLFEYNLTGSVPSSLGHSLSHLQELTLWRNVLSSSIPSSLGLLTELVLLDFDETG
jgi:hypothetical protein